MTTLVLLAEAELFTQGYIGKNYEPALTQGETVLYNERLTSGLLILTPYILCMYSAQLVNFSRLLQNVLRIWHAESILIIIGVLIGHK